MEAATFERLLQAYGSAIRILDPIRFRLWAESGLTMPQARLLYTLVENGDQSAGELAERFGVSPSTITGLSDRLVRQQLIERKESPSDRRVVLLSLTDEGRRWTLEMAESSKAYLLRIFEEIPEERLLDLAACLEEISAANDRFRSQQPLEVTS